MKIVELGGLAEKDLREKLENVRAAYNQMKLDRAVSPLENPPQIKIARRGVVCMKAELQQRELDK